jgi:hypothetical protein
MPRDDGKLDYHRRQLKEARSLIRNRMSWLTGFPVFQEDRSMGWLRTQDLCQGLPPKPIPVELVRGSVQAMRRLQELDDDTLRQLGRDPQWRPRVTAIVHWLSQHRMADSASIDLLIDSPAFPTRLARAYRQVAAKTPELRALLDAIFFFIASGPRAPEPRDILWIEQHRDRLVTLRRNIPSDSPVRWLRVAWSFFELRDLLPDSVGHCLMDLLGNESLWKMDGQAPHETLIDLQRQILKELTDVAAFIELPEPNPISTASQAETFLYNLVKMPAANRSIAIELLAQLVGEHWASRLATIQQNIALQQGMLIQSLEAWARYPRGSDLDQQHRNLMRELANFTIDPMEITEGSQLGPLLKTIVNLSQRPKQAGSWTRLLQQLPDGHAPMKRWLLIHWEKMMRYSHVFKMSDSNLEKWKEQLTDLFRRNPQHHLLLAHWESQMRVAPSDVDEWITEMITETHSAGSIQKAIEAIAHVDRLRDSLTPEALDAVMAVTLAAPSPQRAAQIIDAAVQSTRMPDSFFAEELLTAVQYSEIPSEVVAILEKMSVDSESYTGLLWPEKKIHHPNLQSIARRNLLEGNYNVVKRMIQAATISKGKAKQWRGPVACATTEWIYRFPKELREPLAILAASTPRAATVAEELLGDYLPAQQTLQEEIDRLGRLLDDWDRTERDAERITRIKRRIENLNKRMVEPVVVSAKRLEHLAAKVRRRAEWEWIGAYEAYCRECFMQHVANRLSPSQLDPQLLQEPYIELLDAILQLTPHFRKLGVQMLIDRHQFPSNLYADQPANRKFLVQMSSAGIAMDPWYRGDLALEGKTAAGVPYRVAFAREVLDYLQMGALFGTCLSPTESNFYSTISNAVDINKQVLYGKTSDDQVIGRCLFAINHQGRILTYQRYHRDPQDGFDLLVDQFADHLARQMGTQRASRGRVAKLVSSGWYDDGPSELPQAIDWDQQDGPLADILKKCDAQEFVPQLLQFAGSADEVAMNLERLWSNDLLKARTELMVSLAEAFYEHAEVEDSLRTRFLTTLRSHGNRDVYQKLLRRLPLSKLFQLGRRSFCGHCMNFHELGTWVSFGGLILDHSPSAALRFSRELAEQFATNPDAAGREEHQAFLDELKRRFGNR